ncbi:hypothetical protein JCM10213_008323 [Rhodosporidiobolus nylandii]
MPLPPQRQPPWSQPLSTRPRTFVHPLRTAAFAVLFNAGILLTFALLILLLPLRLVRHTRPVYGRIGKAAFGSLLVFVTQHFAPTEVVVSAGEGVDRKEWAELDEQGELKALRLPEAGVWIANHSTLVDWLFLWSFSYLSGHHSALYIALKSSLRRIPIIGWSCSLFNFLFLDRKWESDKRNFRHQLDRISRTTLDGGAEEKAAVLIFPEGTITTENTRGISARYAEKAGLKDYTHLLIPRSTGLFYALRHLALTLPHLSLVDLTLGYPIPRSASLFHSDYYDIPSVLLRGVPPPELHIHIRTFPVSSIPLGDSDRLRKDPEADCTPQERAAFEKWLEERWREKDALLERYRREGSFVPAAPKKSRKKPAEDSSDDEEDDRRPGEFFWRPHLQGGAVELVSAFSPILAFVIGAVGWWYRGVFFGGGSSAAGEAVATKACGCGKMAAQAAGRATAEL